MKQNRSKKSNKVKISNEVNKLARNLEVIKRNSVDLITEEDLTVRLKSFLKRNRPLKLKIGFDPTARDIHLGHTVLLRKLRELQNIGHWVYLIIGDFTAKIGDPSQKTVTRPVLSDKEIKANAATYTSQVFKILDKKKTKVIYNSIWYKKMSLSKFLALLSSYTVARVLERDDFSKRIKAGKPLSLLEVVYPLIQGYDSCMMEADIEFGGTDQKFNLIVGRRLQEAFGQRPQAVVTMPILVGLDGQNKMSKSLNNYIGVTDKPKAMFGKIMSISDEVMWEYYRLLCDCDINSVKKMHPKEAKMALALEIVSFYHSKQAAAEEKKEFERVFSRKETPENMPVYKARSASIDLVQVLHKTAMAGSKNEIRRLLSQGGISILDENNPSAATIVKTQTIKVPAQGLILKIGKKRFLKVVL